MKILYILIGPIASGKSTWSKNFIKDNPETLIVNRDSLREMVYGEYLFLPEKEPIIKRMAIECTKIALWNDYDVIIDETNLTRKKRESFLKNLKDVMEEDIEYKYIYFSSQNGNVERRMKSDSRGYTKEKWQEVYDGMMKVIEKPTEEELNNKICLGIEIIGEINNG